MIYSLIPPILIVLSLAGIVIFLIKKAPEVANLIVDHPENNIEKKSLWARITRKEKTEEGGLDFKHKLLLFLEKNTKKLKLLFLKLENIFSVWGESFRNKRKAHEEEKMIQAEEAIEIENVLEATKPKVEFKAPESFERIAIKQEIKQEVKKPEPIKPEIVRPAQSIEYVQEEKKVKSRIKNNRREVLEKILVERIAADPRDTEAYEQLGGYYLDLDNFNYAKECFKQVLKIDPQSKSVKEKMKKLERMIGK